MSRLFDAYGRWVGYRPWAALAAVLAVTVVAVVGFTMTAELADDREAFLPGNSELVAAIDKLSESFPASAGLETVQIVLRGDVLSPGGAADSLAATAAAAGHPDLSGYLVAGQPPVSPGGVIAAMVGGPGGGPLGADLASLSQADIDAAIADEANAGLRAVLEGLTVRDGAGAAVGGIGVVTVRAGGDAEGLAEAQLAADEAVASVPLRELESARTLSAGKRNHESDESSRTSSAVLMAIAFAVIAVLLALFYRTVSDVVLGMGGLLLTVVWTLGFQGLLGPDGLGLIGAPNVIGQMVPVVILGLCIDYGIQGTFRYREVKTAGAGASAGISESVAGVMVPLCLAGVTTIISFLTNLLGDISGMADFGVVAGVGVFSGLVVFLTGAPAVRVLLDRRSENQGKQPVIRLADRAIPGAGRLVGAIGNASVRMPSAVLAAVGVLTIVSGVLALRLDSGFNSADLLPGGAESKQDIVFLTENLGGHTEPVTVLVESEITNDRTLRNLLDFRAGIEDPSLRPAAVRGGVTMSLGTYFQSLPADLRTQVYEDLQVGRPNTVTLDGASVQSALDLMRAHDPAAFDAVVAYGAGGDADRTILQFNALTGDPALTRHLFADVDGLWFGNDEDITPIADEIIALEVTDSLTESQLISTLFTIVAAMVVLVLFFWASAFRPMLAVLSALPILVVLVWVLGTMTLLGYSYNVITALITALVIGIGLDYTIHVTHRFVEEIERNDKISEAINATMRTTGGALIGSALTTALGFLVLVFSPIAPIGQFGLLTAITVTYSLIAAVMVLPPMLVIWAAYHAWRNTASSP